MPQDWERYYERGEAQYVGKVVLPQMDDVTHRALAAGAGPPLAYLGAGMTAVVLCDVNGDGFKVARDMRTAPMLREEAEWLKDAAAVPWVADHVVPVKKFDEKNGVILRACIPGRPGRWGEESKLRDIHEEIEKRMIPHGWTSPEFKGDSYIIREDGQPVLVDASMPSRVGENLLRHTKAILRGKRGGFSDTPGDLAFQIRREIGVTLTKEQADPVLRVLCEIDPEACR